MLIAISAILLLLSKDKEDLYLFIIVGISGTLAESFAVGFGVWSYHQPTLYGVPLWLPFLWGIAGVFIKKIVSEIHLFTKRYK